MSVPFEGLVNFNLTSDNEYWSPLQEATKFHLKSRDRYEDLLTLCKSKGVKFVDIKRHLLNEAKKCGLYTRSMWSDKEKAMVFRTWGDLLACKYSWVISLNNFMNYSKKYVDYDVRANKVAKNPVMVNKTTVIRKITDQDGNKKEVKTETIETASNPSPKAQQRETKDSPSEHPRDTGSIVAPISTDLTELQRTTLILQNLNLLGKVCQEKGATKEFNTLMAALGSVEFIIEG
jgi:hypothetical protein